LLKSYDNAPTAQVCLVGSIQEWENGTKLAQDRQSERRHYLDSLEKNPSVSARVETAQPNIKQNGSFAYSSIRSRSYVAFVMHQIETEHDTAQTRTSSMR